MATGMDKPFCAKHRRWPCRECGTKHYDDCGCSVCRPLIPYTKDDAIEKQAKVPDDVARDAERYRWLRDYATEHLYGDELISLFDRHSSAFDAGIDAAMLAAKAKGGVA